MNCLTIFVIALMILATESFFVGFNRRISFTYNKCQNLHENVNSNSFIECFLKDLDSINDKYEFNADAFLRVFNKRVDYKELKKSEFLREYNDCITTVNSEDDRGPQLMKITIKAIQCMNTFKKQVLPATY
ncbi:uncharacterized protein LOC103574515 [Microplitis demolitor]|uniref:uncharacterized protein LOC103574515 n=1 Tax=Microplitis demolitor TaxID=69319 RepID=UPI0004CD0B27|nr:uncharacterized protein LOC103574515 [Microplitis demolitor]